MAFSHRHVEVAITRPLEICRRVPGRPHAEELQLFARSHHRIIPEGIRQIEIGIRDGKIFGVGGRGHEHSGQVARIVTNQHPRTRRKYTGQDGIPVANPVDLKAISSYPTGVGRKKIDNEACWVGDNRRRLSTDRVSPELRGNCVHAAVDALVVAATNFQRHPALELRHRHNGARLASILAAFDRVRVRGSGQSVDSLHERTEIALNMGAKLRPTRGPILKADTVPLTATSQRQAVKLLGIVHMYQLWYAGWRPLKIEFPLLEPFIFG